MRTQTTVRGISIGYVLPALIAFVPIVHQPWPPHISNLIVENGYGLLFGVLPYNLPLRVVHLALSGR